MGVDIAARGALASGRSCSSATSSSSSRRSPTRRSIRSAKRSVMSLVSCVGGEGNLLEETPKQCRMLELPHPILTNDDMAQLRRNILGDFRTCTLRMTLSRRRVHDAGACGRALRSALDELCKRRRVDAHRRRRQHPHPQRSRRRRRARADPEPPGDVGGAPSPHSRGQARARRPRRRDRRAARGRRTCALLIGFGAGAVNPYLALESIAGSPDRSSADVAPSGAELRQGAEEGPAQDDAQDGHQRASSATRARRSSRRSASIRWSSTTTSPAPSSRVARRRAAPRSPTRRCARHARGFGARARARELDVGGQLRTGARPASAPLEPKTVAALQKAVRLDDAASYAEYARLINEQTRAAA